MLRVETHRFKPRYRRRWLLWFGLSAILLVGLLLGLLAPRGNTTIELGNGALFQSSAETPTEIIVPLDDSTYIGVIAWRAE